MKIETIKPAAYAVFADNGNIRIWSADSNQVETLRAEIERLKATLDKQWLPIDTAPTDGTNVLVLLKSGSVMQAEFWDFWMPVYFSSTKIEPTHWQPLPPSPEK